MKRLIVCLLAAFALGAGAAEAAHQIRADRPPSGQWFFKGHVDMDNGTWHVQPQPGPTARTGSRDVWWTARIEVNQHTGLWRIFRGDVVK